MAFASMLTDRIGVLLLRAYGWPVSDALISYARKDVCIIDQLIDELIAAGVAPWIDKLDIPAGKTAFPEMADRT